MQFLLVKNWCMVSKLVGIFGIFTCFVAGGQSGFAEASTYIYKILFYILGLIVLIRDTLRDSVLNC